VTSFPLFRALNLNFLIREQLLKATTTTKIKNKARQAAAKKFKN